LTACGAGNDSGKNDSSAAGTVSEENTESAEIKDAAEKDDDAILGDNFGKSGSYMARGDVKTEIVDDDKAANGKALHISGRAESWCGVNYSADLFRGNTVKAKGRFRSTSPHVSISVQYNALGNTTYNQICRAETNADGYAECEGTFEIPTTADKILLYIEADNTDDIYVDSVSFDIEGEYTYYPEAQKEAFVDTSDYPSLRELYEGELLIGTCISDKIIKTPEYKDFIARQFSSATMENEMKPDSLLDRDTTLSDPEKYMESPAVKFDHLKAQLDFAKENGIKLRGHTLLWHNQTPEWLFFKDYKNSKELADRELMLKRMENYIKSVFEWESENYPGLFYAWDVVNEAIDDGGGMRKSLWYQTVGEDFVERAFEYARKYQPEGVKLFYNDYNSYMSGKQNDILKMVKPIAEAGNLDGIGMQSHLNTGVSVDLFMVGLKRYYSELGCEIQITELDVGTDKSDADYSKQGDYYGRFMTKLLECKADGIPITSVTVWGITDSLSWRQGDDPLLLTGSMTAKPAFTAFAEAAETVRKSE
nr:endo-1,4-beta-xylanase [Ruminococcus sp.]